MQNANVYVRTGHPKKANTAAMRARPPLIPALEIAWLEADGDGVLLAPEVEALRNEMRKET
jgi:hypothetical protein